MFVLIMRGEEELSLVELCDDAAQGPDVAGLVPVTALQDDLWPAVLPGVDDGASSLGPVRGSSEVYHLDGVLYGKGTELALSVLLSKCVIY